MKIAFLSEKYTPDIGGLAISAERLARSLASAGHDVHVLAPTLHVAPHEKRTLTSNRITVTHFGAHKRVDDTLVDWFGLLVEEYQREPFDILHAYFLTQAGFVAAYAGKYLDVPSVVSARGIDLECAVFDPSRAGHIFYALKHASVVTANANELAKKAKALVPGLEVAIIPNGIDPDHFKHLPRNSALAQSLNLTNDGEVERTARVIGFTGELREKKGLRPLLSAYAQVNQKKPAILLIVGDIRAGEDKQIFEEFQLSHPNMHIVVTGFVSPSDLPAYYSLMDILSGHLCVMDCGKAVIGTSVGGILDAVTDCENGKLVSTNNAEELADAIHELLSDADLRTRFGRAACQTIKDSFTLQSELDANLFYIDV